MVDVHTVSDSRAMFWQDSETTLQDSSPENEQRRKGEIMLMGKKKLTQREQHVQRPRGLRTRGSFRKICFSICLEAIVPRVVKEGWDWQGKQQPDYKITLIITLNFREMGMGNQKEFNKENSNAVEHSLCTMHCPKRYLVLTILLWKELRHIG